MQLFGVRHVGGRWSWALRGDDGTTLAQSARTFGSYALSMIDASRVCDHLQTAAIEPSDYIRIVPLRGMRRDG